MTEGAAATNTNIGSSESENKSTKPEPENDYRDHRRPYLQDSVDDLGGTTSSESNEAQIANLNHLAKDMFQKTADYLQGELLVMKEDYKLLENLNLATAAKYADMRQISTNVVTNFQELNLKFAGLAPLLKQIDQVEDSVSKLEQAAYKLDNYSKRLEAKFKMLEKRH